MVSKTIASEVQIAILGLGTVGKGVKTILEENQNSISENIYRLSGVRTTIKIKKILAIKYTLWCIIQSELNKK